MLQYREFPGRTAATFIMFAGPIALNMYIIIALLSGTLSGLTLDEHHGLLGKWDDLHGQGSRCGERYSSAFLPETDSPSVCINGYVTQEDYGRRNAWERLQSGRTPESEDHQIVKQNWVPSNLANHEVPEQMTASRNLLRLPPSITRLGDFVQPIEHNLIPKCAVFKLIVVIK